MPAKVLKLSQFQYRVAYEHGCFPNLVAWFRIIQIFDMQVSLSRCARAALSVQAHGTPLAHKNRVDGNAHIWGASVSSRCARAALTVQAHGEPLSHKRKT